jgi:hypothetical protein
MNNRRDAGTTQLLAQELSYLVLQKGGSCCRKPLVVLKNSPVQCAACLLFEVNECNDYHRKKAVSVRQRAPQYI